MLHQFCVTIQLPIATLWLRQQQRKCNLSHKPQYCVHFQVLQGCWKLARLHAVHCWLKFWISMFCSQKSLLSLWLLLATTFCHWNWWNSSKKVQVSSWTGIWIWTSPVHLMTIIAIIYIWNPVHVRTINILLWLFFPMWSKAGFEYCL